MNVTMTIGATNFYLSKKTYVNIMQPLIIIKKKSKPRMNGT